MGGASSLGDAMLWVAVTDKIGHVNQCIALTDALGVAPTRMKRIPEFNLRDRAGAKILRRLQGFAQSLLLLRGIPASPLVLVISGRSSEYAAKLLRWRLGKRLFVISVGPPINFPEVVDMAIINQASLPKWRRRRAKFGRAISLEEVPICGAMARRFERPALPRGDELIEAADERRLQRLQKQLTSQELLIIDELGFVPLSKAGAELLFEVIFQRYERGSIIITSNLPFDE